MTGGELLDAGHSVGLAAWYAATMLLLHGGDPERAVRAIESSSSYAVEAGPAFSGMPLAHIAAQAVRLAAGFVEGMPRG